MTRYYARFCLALAFSACCLSAGASNVDGDLRQAAKLHKGGATPQAMVIRKHWAEQGYADGVALDYTKAMQWYRVAADQGDKISQFQIGLMYQTGQGVEANEEEAHRWFTAHRKHHIHHLNTPQMAAWCDQARAMIDDRDRREQLAASRQNSDQVLAELKQRAQPLERSQMTQLAANADQQ